MFSKCFPLAADQSQSLKSPHQLLSEAKENPNFQTLIALAECCPSSKKINSFSLYALLFETEQHSSEEKAQTQILSNYPYLMDHVLYLKQGVDLANFDQTHNILRCSLRIINLYQYLTTLQILRILEQIIFIITF